MYPMKTTIHILYLIAALLITGCITSYEPEGIKYTDGILVVEGQIIEPAGSQIKLSRTKGLNNTTDYEKVNNAAVSIISDDNIDNILLVNQGDGNYTLMEKLTFRKDAKYALDIQIGNKQYQSSFLEPLSTPEIEELGWVSKNNGKEVDILVSTSDPQNKAEYYRWIYQEDWEVIAFDPALYRYDNQTGIVERLDLETSNNINYCWTTNPSKSFILGTTQKLSEDKLKEKIILNIKAGKDGTPRFSHLYSIFVKQHAIDREAYEYFQNLQKNIEQTGSIFSPQPTEVEGNIRCISNPEEAVIGYIYATSESTSRLYIKAEEVPDMREYADCVSREYSSPAAAYELGYGIHNIRYEGNTPIYICYPNLCLDCRKRGGTKNKPDFWPNDHL